MSEVTKKEMLDFIRDMEHCPDWDWTPDSLEILQVLRSLAEAYFEWQEEAALIRRKYPDNLLPAATAILLDRIRDFDFGED